LDFSSNIFIRDEGRIVVPSILGISKPPSSDRSFRISLGTLPWVLPQII